MAASSAAVDNAEMTALSSPSSSSAAMTVKDSDPLNTGAQHTQQQQHQEQTQTHGLPPSEDATRPSEVYSSASSTQVVDNTIRGAGMDPTVPALHVQQDGTGGTHTAPLQNISPAQEGLESQSMVQSQPLAPLSSAVPVAADGPSEQADSQEKVTPNTPTEDVKLELLLLSGSRKKFTFKQSTTVNEVLAWLYKDWPSDWAEEKPIELAQLRLLHRGQFLTGSAPLSSRDLEPGESTVMHLNIKPAPSESPLKPKRTRSPAQKTPAAGSHGGGCCSGCIVS